MTPEIYSSCYALFDKTTGSLVEDLSYSQMRSLLISIGPETRPNWLLWREGETEWAELTDVHSIYLSAAVTPPALPEAVEAGLCAHVKIAPEREPEDLDLRLARRFEVNIKAWVDYQGQISNNEIVDLSISGARLKYPIEVPDDETFWIVMRVEPNPIQVMAKMSQMGVEEKQPRVVILSHKNIELLRNYLLRPRL